MKNIKYLLVSIIFIAIVGGFYFYKEYNRGNKNLSKEKASSSLTAVALIEEYQTSDSISNKKYLGKLIEVNGILKEIASDENGFYTIALGDTASMSSVRCKLDSVENNKITSVLKGAEIFIKGICTGFIADEFGIGSDVILERCVINKKIN